MKQILCFGDSNTWGLIPKTGERFPWGIRWTSILSEKLGQDKYHVVEEGLCGRTTVFDDPLRDGRCGVKVLPTLLESHEPIDLSIIMLGTNDISSSLGIIPKKMFLDFWNVLDMNVFSLAAIFQCGIHMKC